MTTQQAIETIRIALGDRNEHHPKCHSLANPRRPGGACDLLFVVPKEMEPQPKGGTWYTYRYACQRNKKIIIIYPNGATEAVFPSSTGEIRQLS